MKSSLRRVALAAFTGMPSLTLDVLFFGGAEGFEAVADCLTLGAEHLAAPLMNQVWRRTRVPSITVSKSRQKARNCRLGWALMLEADGPLCSRC